MKSTDHHCHTCEFWNQSSRPETVGYHACIHPKNESGDTDGFTGGDCGEPYNAGHFASGPLFGCVHWKRLESK